MKTKIGELARVCTVGNIETTAPGGAVGMINATPMTTLSLIDLAIFKFRLFWSKIKAAHTDIATPWFINSCNFFTMFTKAGSIGKHVKIV